ncbi:MAG: CHAD domain-containing protein [Bacteroidetes bacterium]|nr:CHAD domain-containing protein [Bacteroidota bacterium]
MDSLTSYYHSLLRTYRNTLDDALSSANEDAVHDLRVTTKRLNAIYQLVSFVDPQFKAQKSFRPFKTIFDSFGSVRDLDIAAAVVHRTKRLPGSTTARLEQYLVLRRDKTLDSLRSTIRKQRKLGEPSSSVEDILSSIDEKGLGRFLRGIQSEIGEQTRHDASVRRLHRARRLYKIYLYLSEAADMRGAAHPLRLERIQSTQRSLGKWHDLVIVIECLEELRKHVPISKSDLTTVINEIKARERRTRKRILKTIATQKIRSTVS